MSPEYQTSKLLQRVESKLAEVIGARRAVVTGSGRAALKIALLSLDLGTGNVIVPDLVCPVVPETIIAAGFKPFLADINDDLSLDLQSVDKETDSRTIAIMPVYMYGCRTDDIKRILEFSARHNLAVIEDAAQAFGCRWADYPVGAFSSAVIFSFSKAFFDTFRGGALVTNNEAIADRALDLRRQIQSRPDNLSLAWKNIKRSAPGGLKKLASGILASGTSRPPADGPGYSYREPTFPYHYQDLTGRELRRCLDTLDNVERLKEERHRIVRDIMSAIAHCDDLEPVATYDPFATYTRVPVKVKNRDLGKLLKYLSTKGIAVDMTYRPASDNMLLRDGCKLLSDYPVSRKMSTSLLPLPVSRRVLEALREGVGARRSGAVRDT